MIRRTLFLSLCCSWLSSVNDTQAKDEFLLRSLLRFDDAPAKAEPAPRSDAPQPINPVVEESAEAQSATDLVLHFYSTETKSWLPPMTWASPDNMRWIALESEQPHFVRVVRGEQTWEAGFIDFHAALQGKREPILTLSRRMINTVIPAGTLKTHETMGIRSVEQPIFKTVMDQHTREVQVTGPDGKPQTIRVTSAIERLVPETRVREEEVVMRSKEATTSMQVESRDVASFGRQEYLGGDLSAAPPGAAPGVDPDQESEATPVVRVSDLQYAELVVGRRSCGGLGVLVINENMVGSHDRHPKRRSGARNDGARTAVFALFERRGGN
ncbi:MAG: hypothetical protein QM811_03635 [Pirellulales bacterium]